MEERLLFLDIDGVVNTHMIYSEPIEGRRMVEKDGFYFDLCWPQDGRVSNEYAIRWLNKLCLEYNLIFPFKLLLVKRPVIYKSSLK